MAPSRSKHLLPLQPEEPQRKLRQEKSFLGEALAEWEPEPRLSQSPQAWQLPEVPQPVPMLRSVPPSRCSEPPKQERPPEAENQKGPPGKEPRAWKFPPPLGPMHSPHPQQLQELNLPSAEPPYPQTNRLKHQARNQHWFRPEDSQREPGLLG